MDVFVCPSCARRYAISGSGGGRDDRWRCIKCGAELQMEQSDVARVDLLAQSEPSPANDPPHLPIDPDDPSAITPQEAQRILSQEPPRIETNEDAARYVEAWMVQSGAPLERITAVRERLGAQPGPSVASGG